MLKNLFFPAILAACITAASPAMAVSTGWVNLGNKKEVRELNELYKKGFGQGIVPKKIKCKFENSNIHVKIEYRYAGTQSIYHTRIDLWKNIEPDFKKYKRRGAVVVSRTDLDTNRGQFTCIIWRNWY